MRHDRTVLVLGRAVRIRSPGAGAGEFVYRPPPPWLQVLAVAVACGAALTLDELA
ncbi:hypothetical protein ABN034_14955 [Actinopolymorpha sp. B11F2]|uniref:hypothetical protein n=1 Tax=Actinopolymorpha sp. B11F2 TaxID=3160862 RepID=UPI0032E4E376